MNVAKRPERVELTITFTDVTFVSEAKVENMLVEETFVPEALVKFKFVAVALVTIRLLASMASKNPSQRKPDEPSDCDPLVTGNKSPVTPVPTARKVLVAFVVNKLEAKMFVDVTFVPVARRKSMPLSDDVAVTIKFPLTFKVEVTVEEPAMKPPYKKSVDVAIAPRLETVRRVSFEVELGQPTPLLKQIPTPETVAVAKLAELA